jgi:hypothetical protein
VERSLRLVVLVSTALACGAHLAGIHARAPNHAALGLAVCVLAAIGARLSCVWTLRVLLAGAFVTPGLL